MHRRKRRILFFVFFQILFIVFFIGLLWIKDESLFKVFINKEENISELNITNNVTLNDCVIFDDKIKITGNDPFIVFEFKPAWIWSITLNITDDYSGNYKIYYGLRNRFSEKKVALGQEKDMDEPFFIRECVDSLRIDFEETSLNDEYKINKGKNLIFESKGRSFWINRAINTIKKGFCFFLVLEICLSFLFFKKHEKSALGLCAYGCMVVPVMVNCIVQSYTWSVQIGIIVIICCGLFFWDGVIEEEKWKVN